jgi:hypothetical protein
MNQLFSAIISLFIVLSLLWAPPSQAHAWEPGTGFGTDNDAAVMQDQMSSAPWTANEFVNHVLSITCNIFPFLGENNCTASRERQQSMLQNSAIGNISSGLAMMYDNPPANLAYWMRDTGESLGFVPKQAYAQGIGFNGLAPLLPVWKAFRNIAYVLLALAMVVVGFMVMMRKRIDPKTVVTVQNALPRIVIALILITFSYAIVGFLIDIMYLVIAFLHFIVQANLTESPQLVQVFRINYVSGGFLDLFGSVFGAINRWNPLSQVVPDALTGNWSEAFRDLTSGLVTSTLTVGPLFLMLLAIAYLFAFIRILFMLLGNYVQIILAVLTGPIQILADVFPGGNGFTSWVTNIIANLLAFPVTIVLLMIANAISYHFGAGTLWTPPLLPQPVVQTGLGDIGGLGGLAQALISMGIMLTIPNIVGSIKEAFKAQSAIPSGMDVVGGQMKTAMPLALQVGGMWWQHKSLQTALSPIDKGTGGALHLTPHDNNS